ncbi:SMP-30/gluconolactonase/LRE family protein [Microbulbifer sp. SAOS-129_SWC]|uniref:SMP-30/gluconolactonase/LRE family protein n=1 Tax=Microbulbifer sp. SAOS-129_SWC TaxID=3145235 RepID=UPI003217D929
MNVKIFSEHECQLGESPVYHPGRNSIFWLDILNQEMFAKAVDSSAHAYDERWRLPEMASALALDASNNDLIWMVTDKSFGYFDLGCSEYTAVATLDLVKGMRANDGGVGLDGQFWFGTMEFEPSGKHGSLFSVSQQGALNKYEFDIGIPNTFCWDAGERKFIVSDSFVQKTFSFSALADDEINNEFSLEENATLLDTSKKMGVTPDGGCLDTEGNLWLALWGGAAVACINNDGVCKKNISIPVPQPTSCCFGGGSNNLLFISSAYDGMTDEQRSKYPESGKIFVVETPFRGADVARYQFLGGG